MITESGTPKSQRSIGIEVPFQFLLLIEFNRPRDCIVPAIVRKSASDTVTYPAKSLYPETGRR
jgi:hypothetical protein